MLREPNEGRARGRAMKSMKLLPVLAALGLSGCVTGYGYSDDGYYYGRPSASVGVYSGGYGYGGYGSYGYGPGYYGYYDPYRGSYYDPYYGYYFTRPPIVIIQRPPGDHHDGHGHDGDDDHHDNGHRPPPWHDLGDLGGRGPKPARAPLPSDGFAPREVPQHGNTSPTPRPAIPSPPRSTTPSPPRVRMPTPAPSMPRLDDSTPMPRKGDRRR
jgi:hypothetical protein